MAYMCLIDGEYKLRRYSLAVKPKDMGYVDMRWFNYIGAGVIRESCDKPVSSNEILLFFCRRDKANYHGQLPTISLKTFDELLTKERDL